MPGDGSNDAAMAFARLETLLEDGAARNRRDLRPIVFELTGDAGVWSFDPSRHRLFLPEDLAPATLRLRINLGLLMRIVFEHGTEAQPTDTFIVSGDPSSLLTLAECLVTPKSQLSARMGGVR